MLFVHALLGCDTTSHIYGLGKGVALQLIRTDKTFQEKAKVFRDANKKKEVIIAAGEKAIVLAHKGLPKDNLDNLRLLRFHQKVNSSTVFVQPQVLPPTSAAAKFHSMRVYLQVQQWMGQGDQLKPEDCGWYEKDAVSPSNYIYRCSTFRPFGGCQMQLQDGMQHQAMLL